MNKKSQTLYANLHFTNSKNNEETSYRKSLYKLKYFQNKLTIMTFVLYGMPFVGKYLKRGIFSRNDI